MKNIKTSKIQNKFFITIILIIIILVITNPNSAINSARDGLELWFNVLVPSLLPFLILSELLISLKFVDIFGRLLQPLMKPLFNVSGQGAFPLLMSVMSGYPVGIKLTSRLREKNILTKEDGNRLICFVSTSGPLFILGAVLIGMLNSPKLGPLLIFPHYLGTLTLGLLFRSFKTNSKKVYSTKNLVSEEKILSITNNSLIPKSSIPKSSIGVLISNSVRDSIDSILLIGGFVIIYSVIIELLFISKGFNSAIIMTSNYLHIKPDLIKGVIAGIIELTTGCKRIAESEISLIVKILLCNFLIGWGGLSIHSQALSFISLTDLNSYLYLFSKLLHGILSTIYTYLIYIIFYKNTIIPSMVYTSYVIKTGLNNWIYIFTSSIKTSIFVIMYFIIFSLLTDQLIRKKS